MSKNTFILFNEHYPAISSLSLEQKGKLLEAIYFASGAHDVLPVLDPITNMAYQFISSSIKSTAKKYADRCEQNFINGSRGGRPKKSEQSQHDKTEKTERFTNNQMVNEETEKTERLLEKPNEKPKTERKTENPTESESDSYITESDIKKSITLTSYVVPSLVEDSRDKTGPMRKKDHSKGFLANQEDAESKLTESEALEAGYMPYFLPVKSGKELPQVAYLEAKTWASWLRAFGEEMCEREIRLAYSWCMANPQQRKTVTGIHRFFGHWLTKANDRGGSSFNQPRKSFQEVEIEKFNQMQDERERQRSGNE